ncbi:hypothetical protein JAAARDRAFT_198280 [Jaapia argillacea MUCL 33604]|uniref:Uncharacterized protein n=1 Tax=Jaapia argillacea MUCL 33604 TaxID=933084 RepID=A0A067PPW4_9AGAM|nr:hypothetical protein JAAARDRAFT_198280 [Jaapia argillacea MUCL 33604]
MAERIARAIWHRIISFISRFSAFVKYYIVARILAAIRRVRGGKRQETTTRDVPKPTDLEAQWDSTPVDSNEGKHKSEETVAEEGSLIPLEEIRENGGRKWREEFMHEDQHRDDEIRRDLAEKQGILQELSESLRVAKETNAEQLQKIQDLEQEIQEREKAHTDLQSLYRQKTSDLRAAEQFLTRADPYSGSEITRLVKDLNNNIFQVAATIEDAFDSEYGNSRREGDEFSKAQERLAAVLGGGMAVGLISLEDDPVLVQPAIQAVLTSAAFDVITTWFPGGHAQRREVNQALSDLYESLRHSEPQPIAGRWRSYTSRHARLLPEQSHPQNFVSDVLNNLVGVTFLAGCGSSSTQIRARIEQEVQDDLGRIAEAVAQIHTVIKQETTSCDMELAIVVPGSIFESARMDDTEADPSRSGESLTKDGETRVEGRVQVLTTLLLKPEVALESLSQTVVQ